MTHQFAPPMPAQKAEDLARLPPLLQNLATPSPLYRCGAQIPIRRVYSIDKSPARRSCWNDGGGGAQGLRLLVLAIAAIFRAKAALIGAFGSWEADGSAIGGIRC